jgi:hypothetical protein
LASLPERLLHGGSPLSTEIFALRAVKNPTLESGVLASGTTRVKIRLVGHHFVYKKF